MKICRVEGCNKPAGTGRGMCHMHYKRWQIHGHTEITSGQGCPNPWERFSKQTQRMPNGCLEWTGTISHRGYGQTKWNYKFYTTHRFSWELHFGPIPPGLCVCHHCDNPKCVEPSHLFLGTSQDNTLDAVSKGRHPHGETQGRSKLTDSLVQSIRSSSEDAKKLAKELGVHCCTIYRIRRRNSWKHL